MFIPSCLGVWMAKTIWSHICVVILCMTKYGNLVTILRKFIICRVFEIVMESQLCYASMKQYNI